MQLTFCGAARQVTGSCFLFETRGKRFLVDCGLFQGNRETRAQNLVPFAFDPHAIDFVVLTHAHLDHSGLLPRLAAAGFAGPVFMTPATKELVGVMLPDSAHLQRMEAERAARHGRDFTALYDMADVNAALALIKPVRYDITFEPAAGISVCLRDAGHILGSAIVEITVHEEGRTRRVVLSGDLGQPGRPILRDPTPIASADVLLLEATYGNRNHKPLPETLNELVSNLEALRDGVVIVPAFAVGRTQEFLYYLNQLVREKRLPHLNVFVDSPMATEVTAITARHLELFDEEARRLAAQSRKEAPSVSLRFIGDVRESMSLNRLQSGAIIVAASGMCDGGRVRHHLRHHLPNPHATVLIIGYQADGTLGRRLVDGAPMVRIMGEEVPVRARVATLGGFSAHADQAALLAWARCFRQPPEITYLIHGEESNALALAGCLQTHLGWQTLVPNHGETVRV
jgi:metallo-beta-lactamase family protein